MVVIFSSFLWNTKKFIGNSSRSLKKSTNLGSSRLPWVSIYLLSKRIFFLSGLRSGWTFALPLATAWPSPSLLISRIDRSGAKSSVVRPLKWPKGNLDQRIWQLIGSRGWQRLARRRATLPSTASSPNRLWRWLRRRRTGRRRQRSLRRRRRRRSSTSSGLHPSTRNRWRPSDPTLRPSTSSKPLSTGPRRESRSWWELKKANLSFFNQMSNFKNLSVTFTVTLIHRMSATKKVQNKKFRTKTVLLQICPKSPPNFGPRLTLPNN